MTCDQYFAAIPWPQFAVALGVGLVAGIGIGVYVERHNAVPRLVSLLRPSREEGSRHMKSPLNIGVDWLEERPTAYAAYLRVAPIIAGIAFLASIAAILGVGVVLFQRSDDQAALIESNEANAVTNCQNANESRKASLALWTFLFDAGSPADKVRNKPLIVWIGKLYMPRDCSDLSRKYPLPEPPVMARRP